MISPCLVLHFVLPSGAERGSPSYQIWHTVYSFADIVITWSRKY